MTDPSPPPCSTEQQPALVISDDRSSIAVLDDSPPPYDFLVPTSATQQRSMISSLSRFDPSDYVDDDDHIPDHLLLWPDDWLPDPPADPPSTRSVDFTADLPDGNAVLTYDEGNGILGKIENLHLPIIQQRSPLIAASFEAFGRQHRSHLHALTPLSARPFVRYIYIGSYAEVEDEFEQLPSSLLLHCQLHHLGALFDMPELQTQALINVIRQCEFACSSAHQPIDLCAALRYSYDHIEHCRKPVDNIIAYCIERFSDHKLREDQSFRSIAYSHRQLRFDLARALKERNYADEAALDIIRLPFAPYSDAEHQSLHGRLMSQGHRKREDKGKATATPKSDFVQHVQPQPQGQVSLLTLALRNPQPDQNNPPPQPASPGNQDSSDRPRKRQKSEDCGFVLVERVLRNSSPDSALSWNSSSSDGSFLHVSNPDSSISYQGTAFEGVAKLEDRNESHDFVSSELCHVPFSSPPSDCSWELA